MYHKQNYDYRLEKSSLAESMELDVINRATADQDIAAASVIAGDEAASINIPYMTPPLGPLEHHSLNAQPRQGHYSGDSHDSSSRNIIIKVILWTFNYNIYNHVSEGYTSISVREPLSRIMASARNGGIQTDPHYAFVSDDSGIEYC